MGSVGRVVVVTGAAGGIGRALVDILSSDGDTVVAVDLPGTGVVELAHSLGDRHLGIECDVSRQDDVLALFAKIDATFGRIDVLVNNAAMGPTMTPTVDTGADLFRRTLSVNLIGPFVMAREAARRMRPGAARRCAAAAGPGWAILGVMLIQRRRRGSYPSPSRSPASGPSAASASAR